MKKKVLIFIDWFLPGINSGGPVRSYFNMISHLEDKFDFYVLTRNKDYCCEKIYDNVLTNDWNVFSKVAYETRDINSDFNKKGLKLSNEIPSTLDNVFMFDSSCIHAGTPRTEETRVSIDIRINSVDKFVDGYMGFGVAKPQFKPGGRFGYYEKSIGELYENDRI